MAEILAHSFSLFSYLIRNNHLLLRSCVKLILLFLEGHCLIIIAISTFITLVTALSMSAIATNGEIGGGINFFVLFKMNHVKFIIISS